MTAPPTEDPRTPSADDADAPESRWMGLAGVGLLLVVLYRAGGWAAVTVVVAILVMVFLHELGHYLTARWGGMKVTEFFIGFGPRLWSFRRGETEYGLKAIPAGAYVKVIGMNNLDEVDPADEARTYRQASFGRRLSVAVAGSAMHFLIALVLLFVLYAGFGFGGFITSQAEADALAAERVESPEWSIGEVTGDSLAETVGLQPGDQVSAINGEPVRSFSDLVDIMGGFDPGDRVTFEYVRADEVLTGGGELTEHPQLPGRGFLGVAVADPPGPARVDPFTAVGKSAAEFGDLTVESTTQLVTFFTPSNLGDFFSRVAGDDDGEAVPVGGDGEGPAVSEGDGDRILSIYGAARIGTSLTRQGADDLLQFLIILNIFIGIFNMVPLLPLDGGHVALAVYERVRSIGGPRYHADVAKLLPLIYAVVFVLLTVGVAALWFDITDPVI